MWYFRNWLYLSWNKKVEEAHLVESNGFNRLFFLPVPPSLEGGQRHCSKYLVSRLLYFNQPVALLSSILSWLWATHWEVCVRNLTCWVDAMLWLVGSIFLICHLFCKAVLASFIQESLWTRNVGAMTPCRENLSTLRNAELLLILKQMMCTEQRSSWEGCSFQLVRKSPNFTESDYLLQYLQEFASYPYPESH